MAHAEKIHRELTVDVMELIFIFTIILLRDLYHRCEVVKVARTFRIDAFVDNEIVSCPFWEPGVFVQ